MSTIPNISALEDAMAQFENVNPTYNNPGGIMFGPLAESYGATPAASGLAVFPDQASGLQAFEDALNSYINSGASVTSLVNAWAPPGPLNPNNANYINSVSSATGMDPNTPIMQAAGATPSSSQDGPLHGAATAIRNAAGKIVGWFTPSGTNILGSQFITIALGLILIAGGIFLFKPAQQVIVGAAKKAAKAAELTA